MTNVTVPLTGSGDSTAVVETIAGVAAANRQVVSIGDRAGGAVDVIGGLTESAPGTDTASSGLNGRLQRLAQRLTSLIALLPTALTGSGNLKVALVEQSNGFTPAAGTVSQVTTGGTAVTVISGPCNGAFITNPANAARQGGIAAAEPIYVDMVATPGSTDAAANGTTTAIDPGQSFTVPPLASGVNVKVNAATSLHKFSVEKW
jgi:hypothetical protein